jgi:hypothetical protein
MKYSEILKKAKKHLSNDAKEFRFHEHINSNKDMFICCAIDFAIDKLDDADFHKGIELKEEIQKRLGFHHTIESWLLWNGFIKLTNDTVNGFNVSKRQIQAYRHRWLDSLVSEYQSKGE